MQNNQIIFLLRVQLFLNRKIFNILKITLFFTNFEKKLNLFRKSKDNKLTQSAIKKIRRSKQIYKNIIKIQ